MDDKKLIIVNSNLIVKSILTDDGLWEVVATIEQYREFDDGYKESAEQSIKVIDSDLNDAIGKALLTIVGISEHGLDYKEIKEG